uniref:Uncharacterized protein n=1 Tax=Cacopsylla melanoneura TaxID=428564 RepID=A0A8D9B269_9HEMI
MTESAVLVVGLAEFEVANDTWNNNGKESKDFLESGESKEERQEEKELQLEEFQHDEKRNDQFLQLVTFFEAVLLVFQNVHFGVNVVKDGLGFVSAEVCYLIGKIDFDGSCFDEGFHLSSQKLEETVKLRLLGLWQ